jgi:hypothetical protein
MLLRVIVVGFIIFFSGCASTKHEVEISSIDVKSKKDMSYDRKIDRILIATSFDPVILQNSGDNKLERLQNDLVGSIRRLLRSRGVETQVVEISRNPLDLNPRNFFDYSLVTFNPNQVLELTVPEATSSNGYYMSYTLQGVMYDRKLNKRVWDFNFYGKEGVRSEKLAKAIFEKFGTDGLLPVKLMGSPISRPASSE